MAAASASTEAAIRQAGAAAAEAATQKVEVEASGHAIQMNEDRARNVKVQPASEAVSFERFRSTGRPVMADVQSAL